MTWTMTACGAFICSFRNAYLHTGTDKGSDMYELPHGLAAGLLR